jgi:uncharacterized membrane protein YuzA (DUF378 family)|tara:strand:+ start:133 stop:378 length:246 start_codon:yes stop_codon:yes gene_type:complete
MARKGSQLSWKDLFSFDRFIFPNVATFIWILLLIIWSIFLIGALFSGALTLSTLFYLLIGLLALRLIMEQMLVFFKIYEKL